jgi:hypothetical protein
MELPLPKQHGACSKNTRGAAGKKMTKATYICRSASKKQSYLLHFVFIFIFVFVFFNDFVSRRFWERKKYLLTYVAFFFFFFPRPPLKNKTADCGSKVCGSSPAAAPFPPALTFRIGRYCPSAGK